MKNQKQLISEFTGTNINELVLSWDFLMNTLVSKIEESTNIDFIIFSDAVLIENNGEELILINKSEAHPVYVFEDKKEAVINACVEYIIWYKEHNL